TNVALSHLASQTTALEGRVYYSTLFPRVINANGTADLQVKYRRIRPGFDSSHDGRKIVYVGEKFFEPTGRDTLYTVNSDGSGEVAVLNAGSASAWLERPRFSPDASKVAYVFNSGVTGALNSLRIRDLAAGTTATVPTGSLSGVSDPDWISPTRLVFSAFDGNDFEIYAVNTDGTALVQLTDNSGPDKRPSASYDGSRIAYHSFDLGNNTLSVVNSDGSNLQFLRNDVASGTGIGWSPDGTMLAVVRIIPNQPSVYSIINSSNGSLIRDFATLGASSHPFFDWAPDIETATPAGVNVPVVAGGVDITFSGVTTAGTTTVTPIPPSSAGTAPNGFVLGGIAYEIATTAAYTAPVTICFNVPTTVASTQTAFNALSLMHNEGGVLVDRTSSRDFPSRTICGSVTTLSPFVVAEQVDALLPSITGYVADSGGSPISNVTVQLTGAEDRFTQTDADGFFTFVNLTEGESYTVQLKQLGYLFSEYSEDFFAVTGENSVVFTGTQANFSISGRAVDSSGIPLSGKVVEIEGASNGSTLTDSNGDFVFSGLPADGGYEVRLFAGNQENFSPAFYAIDPLTTDLSGFDFTELAPTAASVSIGGRVVTAGGPGIRNAVVTITDQNSNTRIVRTGSAGYYRFDGIPVGQTVIISIKSRRFTFAHPTRIVNVTDELTDVDFVSDTLE
ncbi:MAG TPA: carboxypeptidase regulatory-like domain-containing protein, partial [Pyrinomonadaceae bacterium]|nr:carboxypeptidase regulatory-like domain-containing protein [Pyrinomonadaceae bacterium]